LSQYSVVSKEILKARYAALFDEDSYDLDAVPATEKKGLSSEFLAASLSRRPILIIGNVGVGKTTFIRYLHKIDAAELVKDAVVLYLDLGSKITLAGDLNEHMLNEFFRQLLEEYDIDIEERNFVRGIYNIDLQRFRKGVYSDLIDINPNQFIEKEVEFLNKKVQDKGQHIQRVLNHIVKGRKKQVVIFIDNADQRDYELQQNAFLIAQELAEHTFSTVFITLRPETYHRSRKMGTLSGYHSKAFTISPPRIDRVINKRLSFARKITSGEISIASLTHLRLENLDSIIRVFIESLERDRSLIQFIDNISGGNVRLALDIVKGFFSSGHVDTEKIIDVYQYSGKYFVPLHEMVRAVIYGDSEHYNPSQSPVPNLYDISSSDIKEHFLLPIILCLLTTVPIDGEHQGFMETDLIYEYCQGLGFSPEQIDSALTRASRYNAIEFSTRRIPEYDQLMPKSARATSMGAYLVFDLCRFFSYFDAIIVDTPIVDRKIRQLLENVRTIEDRLSRANIFLEYLDSAWDKSNLAEKDIQYNWERVSTELKQEITHIRERIESRNSFIS
jgi:GTPase SAR1 family protein